jgi:hypothetical protein
MNNLTIKRLALVVVSLVLGFLITWGYVIVEIPVPVLIVPLGLGTTLDDFGTIYTFFTTLSFAFAIGLILDKYMGTDMLPH